MIDRQFQDTQPLFSQPIRQIVLMLVVVALAGVGIYFAYPSLREVFLQNPYLNGFIFLVFMVGVATCFIQVILLIVSVNWIEDFVARRPGHDAIKAPRLLAPLAALLRARGARTQINSSSSRSILDSVATRIDEARDITRYLVNLLIFLGLLGTFFGLATTVPAVVETIRSLAPRDGESGMAVFDRLMSGLEAQLGGMGVAFSSSLLGLTGSLLVGLLELFAGHGQNRFYRELEDWLSSITRVGLTSGDTDGGDGSAFVVVLDQMAQQMDALQNIFVQSDVSRALLDERLGLLADSVDRLARKVEEDAGSGPVLLSIADGQNHLIAGQGQLVDGQTRAMAAQDRASTGQDRIVTGQDRIIAGQDRIAQTMERTLALQERMLAALAALASRSEPGETVDPESRMRLRSIDVQLLRILEEISAGRSESITDLRGDLAALTAAIRQVSRGPAATASVRRE